MPVYRTGNNAYAVVMKTGTWAHNGNTVGAVWGISNDTPTQYLERILTPSKLIPFEAEAAPAPEEVELIPAEFSLSAVALDTIAGTANADLEPAVVNFSAVTLDPVSIIVNIDLVPSEVVFSAVVLDPQEVLGENADLVPAVFNFSAVTLDTVAGTVNIDLVPSTFNFSAVPLDVVPGVSQADLIPSSFTFSAVSLDTVAGVASTDLSPAILIFSATVLDPQEIGGVVCDPVYIEAGSNHDDILAGLISQSFLIGSITDRERQRLLCILSLTEPQNLSIMDLYRLASERPRIEAVDIDG